ncbi:MAG TPA: hypothetical protein VFO64_06895 [Gaiellaceae bacterium]|nr:hypothetical protein [Gaiellaceae bacterium]
MADDVMDKAAADAKHVSTNGAGTSVAVRPASRAERARSAAYRSRFAAFYVALAVIAGAGVGTLVVLVGRGSPAPAPAWSAWEPTGSIERRAAQIADHVSDQYRLPSGNPLATVTYAGPPTIANPQDATPLDIRALAVASEAASGGEDIDAFRSDENVMYVLCGRGPTCSIPEGQESLERTQLLRRQALELALYSFKFLDGIDTVLVLLPPPLGAQQANGVFLERDELRAALDRPLGDTLTAELTPGVGEISAEEGRVVDRLTRTRVFQVGQTQQQDGSLIMLLAPAPN